MIPPIGKLICHWKGDHKWRSYGTWRNHFWDICSRCGAVQKTPFATED